MRVSVIFTVTCAFSYASLIRCSVIPTKRLLELTTAFISAFQTIPFTTIRPRLSVSQVHHPPTRMSPLMLTREVVTLTSPSRKARRRIPRACMKMASTTTISNAVSIIHDFTVSTSACHVELVLARFDVEQLIHSCLVEPLAQASLAEVSCTKLCHLVAYLGSFCISDGAPFP